ncbi:MAG: hypothetical protein GEU71_04155 [Actinobacteria bacterium]|nr:hypothetical protein [Actinomycetota bacterium]
MTNTQLATFIIGVAVTVVIVGAVLIILFALRGFRNSRTRGGLYPGFEHGTDRGTRELAEGLSTAEPASYRVVEWKPPGSSSTRRASRPAPVAAPSSEATEEGAVRQETAGVVASAPPPPPPPRVRTEGDITVVTSEGRREIVLDEPENSRA